MKGPHDERGQAGQDSWNGLLRPRAIGPASRVSFSCDVGLGQACKAAVETAPYLRHDIKGMYEVVTNVG